MEKSERNEKKNYDLEEWNGTAEEPNRQAEELWGMLIEEQMKVEKGGQMPENLPRLLRHISLIQKSNTSLKI